MKITVAIDSFKGSITSSEAAEAVRLAALSELPDAEIYSAVLADGGEGTVDAFLSALGGKKHQCAVTGPLGEPALAEYGITDDGTAIIEIASAAGLPLVPEDKRDPLNTTTYGVGELISDAIGRGVRNFIVGLGGSATNDGGAGMLAALGFKLQDGEENPIPLGAEGLSMLERIDTSAALGALSECRFTVACDVKNPLLGERGASCVFGPQKGACPKSVQYMDGLLKKFANLTSEALGSLCENDEGAGAAGGLGFAFISYLGASLVPGIDLIASAAGLRKRIRESDLVITGEGRLDGQSGMGKAPIGIAKIAKEYRKPVIAFCGSVGVGAEELNSLGIDAYFPIIGAPCTLACAMDKQRAKENLYRTAKQAIRLFIVGSKQ